MTQRDTNLRLAWLQAMPITALPSDALSLVLAQLCLVRDIKRAKRTCRRSICIQCTGFCNGVVTVADSLACLDPTSD